MAALAAKVEANPPLDECDDLSQAPVPPLPQHLGGAAALHQTVWPGQQLYETKDPRRPDSMLPATLLGWKALLLARGIRWVGSPGCAAQTPTTSRPSCWTQSVHP